MNWREFELEHGIILGEGARKIYIDKVCNNPQFIPGKISPSRFWDLLQANQHTIKEVTQ